MGVRQTRECKMRVYPQNAGGHSWVLFFPGMGSLGHVPSPLWALVSPEHWWGLDWMALKAPLISECVAQGCESGCFGEAGGSECEMSGGGLGMGSCLSSCVCMLVFGVHLPVCGTCGCWCACTCSVAPLCGNMCERACKHGCARDGHQWVSLGWWGWGGGKQHRCRLLPKAHTLLLLSLF